jgi:DNA-binding PadR family transcriptional regulator
MAGLSNAEAALLGLLSEQPMHPYQIEQEVQYRDMRFWTDLSMSSIYKLVRSLEKRGLVVRTDKISPENRLRKLYKLSPQGMAALKEKLEALLTEPEHLRWQVDIGVYNCSLLPPAKVVDALRKYRLALEEKARCYGELEAFLRNSGCPSHRFAVAIRPVYLLRAEIEWIDSYIASLSSPGSS